VNILLLIIVFVVFLFVSQRISKWEWKRSKPAKRKQTALQIKRHKGNPILTPNPDNNWESEATFNPGVIATEDGQVHMIYRAIGSDGVSRLGYVVSSDGKNFNDKYPIPIFSMQSPRYNSNKRMVYDPALYPSGGSWGGCEDPRMVAIEGRIYLTFNCFDGWDFIRAAVVSIDQDDFLERKWQWSKPLLISPSREVNKNWVLFPEKFDGKFAILHSINPDVQVAFVDRLEDLHFGLKKIKSRFGGEPRSSWDTWLRGAGPPPIKTKHGWLVFYHATQKKDAHRFKLGAMLLDLNNPTKVIARSRGPVLSPDMWYENDWKPGVVYACGTSIKNGTISVYYGGGDKVVCLATANLNTFIRKLRKNKNVSLKPQRNRNNYVRS
jgi:beta-1,2-mannobiose phosphorylase / 1,2-beta-oligomannan phosphorylase